MIGGGHYTDLSWELVLPHKRCCCSKADNVALKSYLRYRDHQCLPECLGTLTSVSRSRVTCQQRS